MGATETVARWIVNTSYEDIPPDAIRVAGESCFDCLGTILAGAVQPVGQIIQKYVKEQGGTAEATVLVSGFKTTLANAALANGTMGQALDYDSFGGFGHPTVVIFPPLLALGEKMGASGRDLLEAYVVGCELGIALNRTTKYNQMERGFHSTPALGRLTAAAACAKLLKLDQHKTAMALGMAGSMAGGLIHNLGSMTKVLHAGLTSRDGVMSAQLASMGLTAGDQVLEHPTGFTTTVLGGSNYDLDQMANDLGKPFRTGEALMIKKYPCCGGNHGMLDSIFHLMREHSFDYRDVESVEVGQHYASPMMLYPEPVDDMKGKFSVSFNTAAALVDGEVGVDTFTQGKINDPVIRETMGKVRLNVQSKWDGASGEQPRGTPVKIRLYDGRLLEHTTSQDEILGSHKNPWGFDNVVGKFRGNARRALPSEVVDQAIEVWSAMGDLKDVGLGIRTLVTDGV